MFKTKRIWEERFHPSERGWGIFDVSLDPEKKALLVAACEKGLHLFTIEPSTLDIKEKVQIKDKSGHKGSVLKVEWHPSGRRFATAGTDRFVIIWKDDFTPERQIKFSGVPQVLTWNPKLLHLIAAAGPDFIAASIPRDPLFYRVQSPIWSAAWDMNGEVYALGMENGAISIRDRRDNEMCIIHRTENPVWCLCWAPSESVRSNLLVGADWGGNVGFYESNGKQKGPDYHLDFLPIRLTFSLDGQIIYLSGADKQIHALSTECLDVTTIAEFRAWPQKCIPLREKPNRSEFVVVTADGVVTMIETISNRCSHTHGPIYACRESLVNLSVRSFERNREIGVPVQDAVLNLAVYRQLIAALTPKDIIVLQQAAEETLLKYEELVRVKLGGAECKSILLASRTILLIHETSIQALSFAGSVKQSWNFSSDSAISCTKVIGGSPGKESFIVALQNGTISRILIDQPFIHVLVKVPSVPVGFDVNRTLQKLAIVCENSVLYVYDLEQKTLLFQEAGADSCAWNLYHPDILAFSLRGLMKIKLADQKVHMRRMETPLNGLIIGYAGSKMYYETNDGLTVVDVPHTMLIHQSVELKNFEVAYEIACFGASESDWKMLANRSLESLNLTVAKNCFRRLRDYPLIQLITEIEERTVIGDGSADTYLGEICAFRNRFDDAARLFSSGGRADLAVKMFVELRQFEKAEQWATDEKQKLELLKLRADWAVTANDKHAAVEIFLQLGDFVAAFAVMKDLEWKNRILDVARRLDVVTQKEIIAVAAKYLLELKDMASAVELLERIKDIEQIIQLQLAEMNWEYLLALANREPFYREMILIPYAQFLVEHDRFTEAQEYFAKAGHPEMAAGILLELSRVAVTMKKFSDAAFYHFLLGKSAEEESDSAASERNLFLADLYHAYTIVESTIEDPFIVSQTETVFNAARILAANLWTKKEMPPGIAISYIYYVVAVWGMNMQAYKTARMALEKLKEIRIPKQLMEKFTEVFVQNRVKPFSDPEDLSDFCHSCSSFAPLLNVRNGYVCQNCDQPLIYCHVSFEQLPLVEFVLSPDVTVAEACSLISREPSSNAIALSGGGDMVTFDNSLSGPDPFFADWCGRGPIIANRTVLLALKEQEVVIQKRKKPLQWRFFRNTLADVAQITTCDNCWKFFNHDDWFTKVLELEHCPFCRIPISISSDSDD